MGFYEEHCTYLPAMLGWFFFSAVLTSYNKVIFGSGNEGFPCPLFMTSIHFLVQWIFSSTVTTMYPNTHGNLDILKMSWRQFLAVSVPCGLVTSGDVGASNMALVRISISFYTMIKASSPVFVLFFAFLLRLEKVKCSLIVVVLIISLGEFITVVGEEKKDTDTEEDEKKKTFDMIGLLLCVLASVLSGLRWTLVQKQISELDPPLKTTIATMRILSPTMFFGMIFFALILEKPWISLKPSSDVPYFTDFMHGMQTIGLGFLGGFIAVCNILCEFHLIMESNAIVLMIGGVIKELVTISVGVIAFKDHLSSINIIGFIIVFLGVITYKIVLYLRKLEEKDFGTDTTYEPMQVDKINKKHNKNSLIDNNDTLDEESECIDDDDFILEENLKKEESIETLESTFGDLELVQQNNSSQINRLSMDLKDESEFELLKGAQMT